MPMCMPKSPTVGIFLIKKCMDFCELFLMSTCDSTTGTRYN